MCVAIAFEAARHAGLGVHAERDRARAADAAAQEQFDRAHVFVALRDRFAALRRGGGRAQGGEREREARGEQIVASSTSISVKTRAWRSSCGALSEIGVTRRSDCSCRRSRGVPLAPLHLQVERRQLRGARIDGLRRRRSQARVLPRRDVERPAIAPASKSPSVWPG
jgi:hypothetical protein